MWLAASQLNMEIEVLLETDLHHDYQFSDGV